MWPVSVEGEGWGQRLVSMCAPGLSGGEGSLCVLVTGWHFIFLAPSLCITRVLWANRKPGKSGMNRKWVGLINKPRSRVDLPLGDPVIKRCHQQVLSISLLCCPQTQLHSKDGSYGHTVAATVLRAIRLLVGNKWEELASWGSHQTARKFLFRIPQKTSSVPLAQLA